MSEVADTSFVLGAKSLNQRIRKIRTEVGKTLRSNVEISTLLVNRIKRRFEAQIAPDGSPWSPLRYRTLQAKKRYKHPPSARPDQILQDTKALYDSIGIVSSDRKSFTQRAAGSFRIGITNKRFGRGGRRPSVYGRALHYGFLHRSGTFVPPRPFLGLNQADINAVASMLRRGIIRAVQRV